MKKLLRLLMSLVAGPLAPRTAKSQVSFYGDFSVSMLTYQSNTNVLYGPAIGAFIGIKNFGPVNFPGDIRVSFVGVSEVLLAGLVVRPRIA